MADYIPTITQELLVRLSLPNEGDATILLKVQTERHPVISYVTSPSIPLGHILRDFCRRSCLQYEVVRFLYDGKRVKEDDFPKNLEMEDEDVIDAMVDQIGGSGHNPPSYIS